MRAQASGFMPPALVMIFRRGLFCRIGHRAFEHIQKISRVACLRIALLLQRENRHGQFGEVFESQIMQFALLSQQDRGIEIVAPETAAIADTKGHRSLGRGKISPWHSV